MHFRCQQNEWALFQNDNLSPDTATFQGKMTTLAHNIDLWENAPSI